MKPSIDQQIEAVTKCRELALRDQGGSLWTEIDDGLEAAISTLNWVKRHAPTIKAVLGEFEGAKILPRDEE